MSAHIAEIISAARIPPLAEAAIALGLPVFPCTPNKAPLVSQGFKAATTDRAQIIAAFSQPGAALIGVPTGAASGLTVVDVDIKGDAPGMAWLQDNEHALPPTRTHATRSGGWHLVFRHVEGIRNSAGRIAPGVDVRGEGGYVIFPPSPGYTVADAADPADMPEWLVNACLPAPAPRPAEYHRTRDVIPDRYAEAALEGECRAVASAREGTRNHALNVSAVKLGSIVAAGGLSRGTVEAELLAAARSAGLPTFEAERTIRSGLEFGVRQPRQVRERAEEREVEVHPAAAFLAKIHAAEGKRIAKPLPVSADLMDVHGALKLFVDYCEATAISSQPFLALGAAVCLVGALAGRKYRTKTDLRTNIYAVGIAESGGGKDHARKVIKKALHAAKLTHYLGGEDIASGAAIYTALSRHPALLFQIDEFGDWLAEALGPKAPTHKKQLGQRFKSLYSSAGTFLSGTEYADQTKASGRPREDIQSPHACLYGTTTEGQFWRAVGDSSLHDGLVARILLFLSPCSYPDEREPELLPVPPALVEALQDIARGPGEPGNLPPLPMSATDDVEPYCVPQTAEADEAWRALRLHQLASQRAGEGTYVTAIAGRLAENAMKLALVRAVSRDPAAPVIDAGDVAWGRAISQHCIDTLLREAPVHVADTEYEVKLNKTLALIRKHGPITEAQMLKRGFRAFQERERAELLRTLINSGAVREFAQEGGTGKGRPTVRYAINTAGEDFVADGEDFRND